MKVCIMLLVVIMNSVFTYAQANILTKDEEVIFFPANSNLKERCLGYDCFYDTEKSYKNHKFYDKDKNRFAVGKNKLTPFSEIEGHRFFVNQTQKYTKDGKIKNETYIAFLTREDGAKLILRVPFQPNNKCNDITKGMVVTFYDNGVLRRRVSIPFIQSDTIQKLKELIGKEFIRNSKGKYYLGEKINYRVDGKLTTGYTLNTIIENAQRLSENEDDMTGIFMNGVRITINDIMFKDVPQYSFKQPFAKVKCYASTFYLPLFDYYGDGPSTLNTNYRLVDCFEDYSPLLESFKKDLPPVTNALVNDLEVYYGRRKKFRENDNNVHYASYYIGSSPYKISDGYYRIDKIDFDFTTKKMKLCIYMKDSLNNLFVVPTKASHYDSSKEYACTFYDAFYLKSDIVTLDSLENEKEKAAHALELAYKNFVIETEKREISSITKRYGHKIATYYKRLSESDRNTFQKAAAKWGANTAKDIVEGFVRIGWNREKCRMSWGEPRDINTSIGVWGRHEQWCYYSSYLYFENGILTSIQN